MFQRWRHRRQRHREPSRYDNNFKARVEDALRSRVERQMFCRAVQLNPFPIKIMDLYTALHTSEELEAFGILSSRYSTVLDKNYSITIKLDSTRFGVQWQGVKYAAQGIRFQLPKELPCAPSTDADSSPYLFDDLPPSMKEGLMSWAKKWLAYELQSNAVSNKLGELFRVCNTVGHLLRVWPAVESFLPEEGRAKLIGRKARSPYPEAVLEREYNEAGKVIRQEVVEEWRPETLKPYELLITEALIMPELSSSHRHHKENVEYVLVNG